MEASIDSLSLSIRAINALHYGGYKLIRDLCGKQAEDLLSIRNFGSKSLEELQERLSHQDIPFPVPSITAPTSADPSENPTETGWNQHASNQTRQPLVTNQEAASIVLKEADACMASMQVHPENRIQDLLSRGDAIGIDSATQAELSILKESLANIELLLTPNHLQSDISQAAWFFTKKALFTQFGVKLESGKTRPWIKKLQTSIRQNEGRDWGIYLQRACNFSLQAIGDSLNPSLTRERVRQILRRTSVITGSSADDLAQQAKASVEEQGKAQRSKIFQAWVERFGRLPSEDDLCPSNADPSLWQSTIECNPLERLNLYNEHQLPVPLNEWDVHYQWICKSDHPVGNGYWHEFEHLRHFLLRHAEALGDKEAMPKQTSLPRRVGGVVQNFGGQSDVAKRIGLRYQGQLVGTGGGRTYWTEERLIQLIEDVNRFHKQSSNLLPSRPQIYEFFREQQQGEYSNKKPGAPIAGMTQQGQLQWPEVAERFGKEWVE